MAADWEDYVYPGTQVLRNKAEIRDQAALDKFERGVTSIRIQELRESPVRGDFDLKHLQDIHKQVFKDVYEFAGDTRTVDMVKGSGPSRTLFAFTEEIPKYAERAQDIIKEANYGRGQDKQELAKTMTDVYTVVNEMHPFREGNGRATREFMNELASQSGTRFDYTRVDKQTWNEAAKEAAHNNPAPMREVFYEITTVERAVAFDKLQPAEALAKHPELDGAYKSLMNARESGLDESKMRGEISRELHNGKIVASDVSREESANVIDRAASYRGLMVRDAAAMGGTFKGEVVSVSSHHALLKVGEMVAVRYERENLGREVYAGERLTIQHGADKSQVYEQGKEPARERGGRDMQMEKEREFNSR